MNDLIFVSMENWDEIWRRNQFICSGLAKRHPHMKILFVAPPRDVSNRLRRGKISDLLQKGTQTVPGYPNITVTRPLKLFPNTLNCGRKLNELNERKHLLHQARKLGIASSLLWLNPHYSVHMCGNMGEAGVIYDITDDWTSLTQAPALTKRITEQDNELCRRATAVIVCSERLFEMKKKLSQQLYLIPNGVDVAHYRRVLEDQSPLPKNTLEWKKPVVGYTGTVHPDRVDLELLAETARRLSEVTFVLIGPNLLSAQHLGLFRCTPNVKFVGQVSYYELPEYMRAFAVCMTPHKVSPFTESLNPIKLWEYLAAGKPIVSTNVAGFRDYPQFVRIADNPKAFALAISEALNENPALGENRRSAAQPHSWDSRLDAVEKVIMGLSPISSKIEVNAF